MDANEDEVSPTGGTKLPHVVVKLKAAGRGTIEIDGKQLRGCRKISINAAVGQGTYITFEMLGSVDYEDEVDPADILAIVEATDFSSETKEYRHFLPAGVDPGERLA